MPTADPELPDVFTRAMAMEKGLSHHQIVRRVRTGVFRRLRTGVYCLDETWRTADRRGQHLLMAKGAYLAFPARCLSHVSAAAWHGLPLPFDATPVWLTGLPRRGTWYDQQVHVQAAPLLRGHVLRADGLKVTTLARTVADCLRHLSAEDAAIIGDAAVRQNSGLRPKVEALLGTCTGWPFTERARHRLPRLDGRHESPLESASFVEMRQHDLPLPEPQVWILDEKGRVVGRGDFYWEQYAVLGEADGLMKYDLGADREGRRALVEEKRREDRLRALGLHVVRWGLAELRSAGWSEWLRRELEKGDPGRFRGSVRLSPFL
jgi:hypothetical protein